MSSARMAASNSGPRGAPRGRTARTGPPAHPLRAALTAPVGMQRLGHAVHALAPRDARLPGQLVHPRRVDRHAVDGLLCRLEPRLGPGQSGQVGAPLLDADRLTPAPVDRHRRHGRSGEQPGHHGQDVVGVQRVVDARGVDVDGDGVTGQHHVQVDGGPAAVVAVGHGEPRNGGREPEALCRPAGRALGRDLADAVRAQERPHAVVVAERAVLVEDAVALGLVDGRRRAVQKGAGVPVVLHEIGQAAAVGRQVLLPVVRLGHGEVEHVVGVSGQLARRRRPPGRPGRTRCRPPPARRGPPRPRSGLLR